MSSFHKRIALRIAASSLLLACIATPVAWLVAREAAEQSIVSLAMEESSGLLQFFHANDLPGAVAPSQAEDAAKAIAGGLFDIAEIYDPSGKKLAEALTAEGKAIEVHLPPHVAPNYREPSYQTLKIAGQYWVLRVFIPLRPDEQRLSGPVSAYFEGVRVVPDWQREQIYRSSLMVALMAGLASLLCGAVLYPVLLRLYAENEQTSQQLLASQEALIETLQQSEQELERKVSQRTEELQQAQARTVELLHNILPIDIANELSETGVVRSVRHDAVSILFADFSQFTQAVATMPADRMVAELNEIFVAFDRIADDCGVEKIKTIGDAYMAAAGLPKACSDHAQRCVRAALEMLEFIDQRNQLTAFKWALRVGIHSGPVVAGVVGKRKYAFDIWGDTVNIAARMEGASDAGRINVSAYTFDLIQKEFACTYRGKLDAKGKGMLDMYYVVGSR